MTTVFQRVGPYEILSQIGEGGMGLVFLALDTRSDARVALKLVPKRDPEIVEAERRGAALQAGLSSECALVPRVFEHGDLSADYFFIAMEFVEGENLSDLIARGPVEPPRAAHIAAQLSEFLVAAHRFDGSTDDRSAGALVHGDLKPKNVRISPDGDIRIVDFGIAKALSLSRKVTRNDFGSLPYMSPERLDSLDAEVDASVDLWALGVILYELLTGMVPFHAPDTRRLERQIRGGVPRRPIPGDVPVGLRAIVGRLMAPALTDRYGSASAVQEDLRRFTEGHPTEAEQSGFPRALDEDATRRTTRGGGAEEATRRTRPEAGAPPSPAAVPPAVRSSPVRRTLTLRSVLIGLACLIVLNEMSILLSARMPTAASANAEAEAMTALWERHASLSGRSLLRVGVAGLERALRARTLQLSEQVIANYRGPLPTVRERQWAQTRTNLQMALASAPGDPQVRAALRYCEGHLQRIDGEAEKSRRRGPQANQHFADAVIAFREAAELRRDWPDPFLGLARTFIYGLDDIDRAADAIKQAQERGYTIGDREVAQLGDGYRTRGDRLRQTARQLALMPQETEYLQRALEAYREALAQYERIPNFPGTGLNLQRLHRAMGEITARIELLAFEKAGES